MGRYLVRRAYLERIGAGRDDCDVVKVITGIRRCGKSVLLRLYREELISSGADESDIFYLDFESFEGRKIKTCEQLDSLIAPLIPDGRTYYILLDEIQNVKGWELTLASLNSRGNCDVYITGSNSDMLSSELATHISGRHVEIRVLPLSLKEFCEKNGYDDREKALRDYMEFGGLPGVDPSRGREYCWDYLQGVFSTVMVKDVMRRSGVADPGKISAIAHFLQSNIGNITNDDAIARSLGLGGATVGRYLSAMLEAFLFFRCPRYDMVGRNLLKTNGKYYVADLGMRNAELGMSTGEDISRPLENIVFLELMRRGYDLRVGSYRDSEIDFIAKRHGKVEYFQVCQTLLSDGTMNREMRPLSKTGDNRPKTILTLDRFGLGDYEGVSIVNLADWLMDADVRVRTCEARPRSPRSEEAFHVRSRLMAQMLYNRAGGSVLPGRVAGEVRHALEVLLDGVHQVEVALVHHPLPDALVRKAVERAGPVGMRRDHRYRHREPMGGVQPVQHAVPVDEAQICLVRRLGRVAARGIEQEHDGVVVCVLRLEVCLHAPSEERAADVAHVEQPGRREAAWLHRQYARRLVCDRGGSYAAAAVFGKPDVVPGVVESCRGRPLPRGSDRAPCDGQHEAALPRGRRSDHRDDERLALLGVDAGAAAWAVLIKSPPAASGARDDPGRRLDVLDPYLGGAEPFGYSSVDVVRRAVERPAALGTQEPPRVGVVLAPVLRPGDRQHQHVYRIEYDEA